jgi:hypothetical protein
MPTSQHFALIILLCTQSMFPQCLQEAELDPKMKVKVMTTLVSTTTTMTMITSTTMVMIIMMTHLAYGKSATKEIEIIEIFSDSSNAFSSDVGFIPSTRKKIIPQAISQHNRHGKTLHASVKTPSGI